MKAAAVTAIPARAPPRLPHAYASPPIAVKSPATGLASGLRSANANASRGRLRWRASAAASPNAVPSANARRLVASSVTVPSPSQSAPNRALWPPKCARASCSNSAAQATQEATSSSRGPTSHASGGDSTLYAGVWWPPYQCPFQMVKPSRPNSSARKT